MKTEIANSIEIFPELTGDVRVEENPDAMNSLEFYPVIIEE